jgi:membrane-associated phospholipid phosphatase
MEGILDWGVRVILWLQQGSPTLDTPFKVLTLMGNETFYLVFFPLIYWCVDRRFGARLIVLFLVSSCVNALAKELAGQPRPFQYDRVVQKLWNAGGGGFPSGHTQSAVVIWGYLASQSRRAWLWVAAGFLVVLIPLSRVYLGVHFPTDLLGGYLIGASLLLLYLRFEPGAEAWLADQSIPLQLAAALAFPCSILLLSPGVEEYQVKTAASMIGMGAGFVVERRWIGFDSGGIWWKRVMRLFVGMAIMVGLRQGLGLLEAGSDYELVFGFVRYVILGLGGALIAPWVFVTIGLADRGQAGGAVTSA